jgi:hypothetical protein
MLCSPVDGLGHVLVGYLRLLLCAGLAFCFCLAFAPAAEHLVPLKQDAQDHRAHLAGSVLVPDFLIGGGTVGHWRWLSARNTKHRRGPVVTVPRSNASWTASCVRLLSHPTHAMTRNNSIADIGEKAPITSTTSSTSFVIGVWRLDRLRSGLRSGTAASPSPSMPWRLG